ncbi:hypothetical protein MiSe_25910 [Microseira wollei NIES-4236]|uniref:Uncharacterized protein n=2 Tax=Microseira wollei TaxID=467598 RepID=A0AAV3XC22_9CYAN|nr:hypothetical protein MiSe_25910 [Microseira wollei NIES-4236]
MVGLGTKDQGRNRVSGNAQASALMEWVMGKKTITNYPLPIPKKRNL